MDYKLTKPIYEPGEIFLQQQASHLPSFPLEENRENLRLCLTESCSISEKIARQRFPKMCHIGIKLSFISFNNVV